MSDFTFNIDSGFISSLLQTKDMVTVKDSQIKTSYLSGEGQAAYQFIYDITLSTGQVPTVRVFRRKFPNFSLETVVDEDGDGVVGTEENLKYWCEELRLRARHNTLVDSVEEVADKLKDFKTEDALAFIRSKIAYIDSEITETKDVDLTKDTADRVKAYMERKDKKGMRGLATGIAAMDYSLKGLEKETLTTLIANTGVGKTWFEVIIGAYCQMNNCRVLQFVTEMSESMMRTRYEAVLYSLCNTGGLNYSHLKDGNLDLKTERLFIEFLENDLPNLEPLYLCTATGVMSVAAAIDKYKPDLVLIDGVYLMEDDQGAKDDWLRVAHITRDLKKLAKRAKLPIFVNTQADKNTSKKTGPELGSIMYTQAVGQDSDNVIALFRDDVMKNDREMGVKILKQREGDLSTSLMNWDFQTMNFSSIFREGGTDSSESTDKTLGVEE